MKQSELKAILKHHKLWIQSGGAKGKCVDLQDASLQDASLQDADLRCAHLQGANLQCANLQYAKLQCADLQGANLRGACLGGAYLRGAYLVGAKFTTNLKKVGWFNWATFSEDQIPWVVLHPRYHEWADTLKWVKAEQLSA